MSSKLDNCYSIYDLQKLAAKRLPLPIYYYLQCGSDDEYTLSNNTAAFNCFQLIPRVLTDVSKIDMSTTLLGSKINLPFFLAPAAMSRMFHPDGELAAAKAAEKFGTIYSASTVASTHMNDIAAATQGPKIFQVYVVTDKGLNDDLIAQAKEGGYRALCLTVDTVVGGKREAVERAGMTVPPTITMNTALQFAIRPRWVWDYFTHPRWEMANLTKAAGTGKITDNSLIKYNRQMLERKLTWSHAEEMVKSWNGPFVVKGIMSVEDAKRAIGIGATAIMISNHGGRQLDSTPPPIQLVAEMREALGDDVEIIVDGGIRRGTHILKALAMGATACSIGRPYLYGLAAGGQAGVERALRILRDELKQGMTLLGCDNIASIDPSHIRCI